MTLGFNHEILRRFAPQNDRGVEILFRYRVIESLGFEFFLFGGREQDVV